MDELVIGDIYVLSALRARGVEPIRSSGNGRRASWVFADDVELRAVLEQFYRHALCVDALGFSEAIRNAKAEAQLVRAGPM